MVDTLGWDTRPGNSGQPYMLIVGGKLAACTSVIAHRQVNLELLSAIEGCDPGTWAKQVGN